MLQKLTNLFKREANPHREEIIAHIGTWADRRDIPRSILGLIEVKTDDSTGFLVTVLTTNPQLLMGVDAVNVRNLTNHLRGCMQMKLKVQIIGHNIFQTKTNQ